jgi:hypothetical protein
MAPRELGSFHHKKRLHARYPISVHGQSEIFGMFLNGEISAGLNVPAGAGGTSAHSLLLECTVSYRLWRSAPLLMAHRNPLQLSLSECSFAADAAAPWMVVGAALPRCMQPGNKLASFSEIQFKPTVRMP